VEQQAAGGVLAVDVAIQLIAEDGVADGHHVHPQLM
jgi:hypothetical protein